MNDLFDLSGKIAVVTGASSGLGRQGAIALARQGAKVVALARRKEALETLESENIAAVPGDVANRDGLDALVNQIAKPFGMPDILVHAAGLNLRQKAEDVTDESWDATLAVNLTAPFALAQKLVPTMQERGWGRIVLYASVQSMRAFPAGIAYGASKGGVVQLARAMAEAWSPHGINANAIGPGFFETELTQAVFADPKRAARNAAQTCIGRNGQEGDLDGPLVFLCSEGSRFVTGQLLMADGGFTSK
jgi:gluconate 5-dehydrogenase